jgi:hypothetical protein
MSVTHALAVTAPECVAIDVLEGRLRPCPSSWAPQEGCVCGNRTSVQWSAISSADPAAIASADPSAISSGDLNAISWADS